MTTNTTGKKINLTKFQELEMRIGFVRSASEVEGSDKLLMLTIDIGEKEITVVSGIGKKYKMQDLEGTNVVVLVNLEPRDIMGIRSEGMILAADGKEGPILLSITGDVSPGTAIR